MKKERQNVIMQIIASTDVETQNQLIDELAKAGIESTQATVSRDIKDLHLIKELTSRGSYRYTVGNRLDAYSHVSRLKAIFKESVTSYAFAQNIVVLKTLPGLAPAACSAIDGMEIKNLIGTLAGDDTAFLAMSDISTAEKFCKEIEDMLK